MTHAYYIHVNTLITSVLALLYLLIVVTVTEVVSDYQLQVILMSCMLLIPRNKLCSLITIYALQVVKEMRKLCKRLFLIGM